MLAKYGDVKFVAKIATEALDNHKWQRIILPGKHSFERFLERVAAESR